jgi:hypothetical protein
MKIKVQKYFNALVRFPSSGWFRFITIFNPVDDFDTLPIDLRAQIVWTRGRYVETIVYYNQRVNLYSIDEYFVEVFYNGEKNEVERITIATDQDIKKYIMNINLSVF